MLIYFPGTQTEFRVENPVMKDVFQLVRPDYFEPDTVRRLSVSSNTSTDEPLSSPFKDDKLDPNFQSPNSPLTTCDSDIEEAALNENRYQHKMLYILMHQTQISYHRI
jgi:hypothetical protein